MLVLIQNVENGIHKQFHPFYVRNVISNERATQQEHEAVQEVNWILVVTCQRCCTTPHENFCNNVVQMVSILPSDPLLHFLK